MLVRIFRKLMCMALGCELEHVGGANAGCDDCCGCSVPVYRCTRCKGYDYGENEEADEIRAACRAEIEGNPRIWPGSRRPF